MHQLLRFLVDCLIPAALTAVLNVGQRFGYLTLLPLNAVIEKEYGNYALMLGAAGAFVASSTFTREGRRFGIGAFLAVALAGAAMAAPFVLARYGMSLGLSPRHFALVATFAYLGFYVTAGLLCGGCWSIVVNALRNSDPANSSAGPTPSSFHL
jgi:hypothetical protein